MLQELFGWRDGSPPEMPVGVEGDLIALAQVGDQDAMMRLLVQYSGALQAARRRVQMSVRGLTREQVEDLESRLVLTALETIKEFDAARFVRLSQTLPKRLNATASEMTTALTIPKRTLSRWFRIWRMADHDFRVAIEMAPYNGMSANTFRDIAYALEFTGSDWLTAPYNANKVAPDVETSRMVYTAMEALNQRERPVIQLAYGFQGHPSTDDEVGDILGLSKNTVRAQRTRGLEKMREHLTKKGLHPG